MSTEGIMATPVERHAWDVLIVDDDMAIRDVLTEVIAEEGYVVSSASHGGEALDRLRQAAARPQLILLDLMMPVMSGWDFRAEQQRDAELARIPVVVLSADRGVQSKASMVQADGYLAKPVDLDVLLDIVRHYCG